MCFFLTFHLALFVLAIFLIFTLRFFRANGDVFTGTFANGAKSMGVIKYADNGEQYSGSWEGVVFHGQGVYNFANGDVYDGLFVNGQRSGVGKLTDKSGNVIYEGK